MNVQEALSRIRAPKGITTLLAGVMSGDLSPAAGLGAVTLSLAEARRQLARVEDLQRRCQSDWAWWGYEGDKVYWQAVVSILEAAELVGPDNLPDVPAPRLDGLVLMDACHQVEQYARQVLALARAQAGQA